MPVTTATEQPYRNPTRGGGRFPLPGGKGYFGYAPSDTWRPDVNLYETDSVYLVCVDLAGVDKDRIEVLVEAQTLKIRGTRPVPAPEGYPEVHRPRLRVHLMEIDNGNFFREVELPADVVRDKISASHRNGMLWIELPKR